MSTSQLFDYSADPPRMLPPSDWLLRVRGNGHIEYSPHYTRLIEKSDKMSTSQLFDYSVDPLDFLTIDLHTAESYSKYLQVDIDSDEEEEPSVITVIRCPKNRLSLLYEGDDDDDDVTVTITAPISRTAVNFRDVSVEITERPQTD